MNKRATLSFLALIPVVILFLFPAGGMAQVKLPGEKLDASAVGPSFVEDMAAALERNKEIKASVKPSLKDRQNLHGIWEVPSRRASARAHSGTHYAVNKWGDVHMGIDFKEPVFVRGAYFAGQSDPAVWARGIRVIGFREGQEKAATDWFYDLSEEPTWLAMNLSGVDRIEIEALPAVYGAGFYAMDDLTYSPMTSDGQASNERTVVTFDDLSYEAKLTGSGYAGLVWEEGTGNFEQKEGVHAPRTLVKTPSEVPPSEEGTASASAFSATQPILLNTYQGVIRGDAGSMSYPPDTIGAVGPNHFVETVNRNFAIYDKTTGAQITNILLGAFLPGSNGDPRVLYDQYSGRFIVIVCDFDASATIYMAVSMSSDPTALWFKTSFVTAQGGDAGRWPDYPTLGVDANGIYITAYMVGGPGHTIWALEKAPLVAPNPGMGTITAWRNLDFEGAVQPCHTFGTASGEYLVSVYSSSALHLRRVNPPLTAPTLTDLGQVSVPSHSVAPDAPALGSNVPLDTVDDRLMMALYRDGSVWTGHTVSASGRAGCRWYEINAASASLIQSGLVADASLYYFFPAIMVSQYGDAVMGFTGSNSSQYAGCYYTGRLASDSPGEMAVPAQYKAGTGPQNNIDSYGRNRWGDYSYTTLDPTDEKTFWTIQEYGHSTDIWGTYMAKLQMVEPPLSLSFPDGLPGDQKPGPSVTIRVEIADRAEQYVPGSGMLFYRYDGGTFLSAPLASLGGDLYEATLPNTAPGDVPEYYFSAQGDGGSTVFSPEDAPAGFYAFEVYLEEMVWADDFETDKGWTVQNTNVQTGAFERADPVGTDAQPEDDHTPNGTLCYVTGAAGGGAGDNDLDGGPTQLISPAIDLSAGDADLSAYLWFYHSTNGGFIPLSVDVSNNNGSSWTSVATFANNPSWFLHSFKVGDFVTPTAQVRVRYSASDNPNDSVVEALVDDFSVVRRNYDASLWVDAYDFSAAAGAQIALHLNAGPTKAGRQYFILGGASGTSPGFPLPGGLTVMHLNWDVFTDVVIALWNSPICPNFRGTLDAMGTAQAAFDTLGPVPAAAVGAKLYFAFATALPYDFTSNPIEVEILP